MDRQEKLNQLKAQEKQTVNDDRQAFIELLNSKFNEFKESLELGVELKDTQGLLDQLKQIEALTPAVEKLEQAIKAIKTPDYPKTVKLENIPKIVSQVVDLKPIEEVSKRLEKLTKAIDKIKVPKQGQRPEDFLPMRRVVKVDGAGLLYDDSFYTGGGGGGSNVPTKNGAVPVTNPDGSLIGGGGGLTNAELRATPVPVSGTFSTTEAVYTTRIDTADATTTYIGSANPGSDTSVASWQIKKIDSSNPTSILFADGDSNFNNVWDDRTSLAYS